MAAYDQGSSHVIHVVDRYLFVTGRAGAATLDLRPTCLTCCSWAV
jgi:hypothetical protein